MTTHVTLEQADRWPSARLDSIMDAGPRIGDGPVRVGEIVVMHGRGYWRHVRVTKVTPRKIYGAYTTASAIAEARGAIARGYPGRVTITNASADRDRAFRLK